MKPKENELLQLLYHKQDTYLTSKELASRLSLSERTVRSYIRRVQGVIEEYGGQIVARQGCGYKLVLPASSRLESLIGKNRLESLKDDEGVLENRSGRLDVLLNRLLLNEGTPSFDQLAEDLYISESTLKKDLSSLADLIAPYELELVQHKGRICLEGDEKSKRKMILDHFFRKSNISSLCEYMDHSSYFDDLPVETLLMIILEEARQSGLDLSDMMTQNILLHLALSLKRISCGQPLSLMEETDIPVQPHLYEIARGIGCRITQETGIDFPEEEIRYLALHLAVKILGPSFQSPEQFGLLEIQLEQALEKIETISHVPFTQDEELKKNLLYHLVPMIVRLDQNIQQKNPLLEDLRESHPDILLQVEQTFSQMPLLEGQAISEDEWAYLAIHLLASQDRIKELQKLQVLVICAIGHSSSQLLRSRLAKHFAGRLHIIGESGYYDISDEILKGVDLIISTVNMGSVIFGVPFIQVSPFLGERDIQKIDAYIRQKEQAARRSSQKREVSIDPQNRAYFDQLLPEDQFFVLSGKPDLEEVLSTLAGCVSRQEKDGFEKRLRSQMILREKMGSVVFSDTVAVPHPAVPVAQKASFALALIPEGLFWSEEAPAVRFVFLMSPSFENNEGIKSMIDAIIELIDHGQLQAEILAHVSYQDFRSAFLSLMK